jgi:hypothetical protein
MACAWAGLAALALLGCSHANTTAEDGAGGTDAKQSSGKEKTPAAQDNVPTRTVTVAVTGMT